MTPRVIAVRTPQDAEVEIRKISPTPIAVPIIAHKAVHLVVKVEGVPLATANVLRHGMVAQGGDVTISHAAYYLASEATDLLLMGTLGQFERLHERMATEPPEIAALSATVAGVVRHTLGTPPPLRVGRQRLDFGARAYLVGIVNVTTDSFYDRGSHGDVEGAIAHGLRLAEEGADLLEVGGEAAGPGKPADTQDELRRVAAVVEGLARRDLPLIVDTYKLAVARAAIDAGAAVVNDTQSLRDRRIAQLVAKRGLALVLMHFKGRPRERPRAFRYRGDLMADVCGFLAARAQRALDAGVARERIIVDPGIGFSKTVAQDLEVLRRLGELRGLGFPIMLGTSNRSFIGHATGLPVEERIEATAATVTWGIDRGAGLLRVHNVKEMRRVADMAMAMKLGRPTI